MPGLVKLCGLRTPTDALAAVEAGTDLVGLVFAPSPRQVSLEEAQVICDIVRAQARPPRIVGLFVDAAVDTVCAIAAFLQLDLVQLHGNEGPEVVAAIPWPVIKAIRVRSGESVEAVCARILPYVESKQPPFAVLLEAYHPRLAGGTGQVIDWSLARVLAQMFPVFLAGGLTPDTVGPAIEAVRPLGVDVSSGVERNGRKDPVFMQTFVEKARAAFARVAGDAVGVGKGEGR